MPAPRTRTYNHAFELKRIEKLPTVLSKQGYKNGRIARALDQIFPQKPDYKHVDKPGARIIRGNQY